MRATARIAVFLLLSLSLGLAGCTSSRGDCADGADNDGDGLVDDRDPGCALNGDLESPDPNVAECEDLADNDGDGLVDLDDPGCATPEDDDERNNPIARCRNGVDDDSDGRIDFPNDPGCEISLDDDETDECPSGPQCPACSNGEDDDGDGDADYPDDLGCDSAGDREELNEDPTICGPTVPLLQLPADGIAQGTAIEGDVNDLISPSCGGNGPETAYRVTVDEASALLITTDFEETNVDTVVYLRSDCRKPDTELGCNDDDGAPPSRLLIERVEPGDYFLIVDSQLGETGEYKVQVSTFTATGDPCDPQAPACAPGYECRLAGPGAGAETCEVVLDGPTCNDGGTFREVDAPAAGDLVISEYLADPSQVDDALGEWFEVKVNADVDLNGLELGRAEPSTGAGAPLVTLSSADCMPATAGSHLVFARSDAAGQNGGLPQVDHLIDFDVVNDDDGLFLATGGTPLDEVTWATTTTGTAASLDSGGTWCAAADAYGDGDLGTPGGANPACP